MKKNIFKLSLLLAISCQQVIKAQEDISQSSLKTGLSNINLDLFKDSLSSGLDSFKEKLSNASSETLKRLADSITTKDALGAGAVIALAAMPFIVNKFSPYFSKAKELEESNKSVPFGPEISPELQQLYDQIDKEIKRRGGVDEKQGEGKEAKTLLMEYSQDGNLDAVKYLVEEKAANINILDDFPNPRPTLVRPAFTGKADIIEYLSSLELDIQAIPVIKSWAIGGLKTYHKDQEKFDRIMAALDSMKK